MTKARLQESDFARASAALNCQIAAIKAVCTVEAPGGGFDENGLPRILFEGHKFSKFTGGRFDSSHPTISYPEWTRKFYCATNAGEHDRLALAASLDREAALKSASWGKFQIMGFNFSAAGFTTLQAFINAMYASEGAHLDAFVAFIKSQGLAAPLRERRWADFALRYNGPAYAENNYHTKLAKAFAAAGVSNRVA